MTDSSLTVLCVDPDPDSRANTLDALDRAAVDADGVPDVETATGRLGEDAVDCVVAEYDLPDGTALDLFDRVRDLAPGTGCVLYTDAGLADIDTRAFGDTVAEFLPRDTPDAGERLADLVQNVVLNRTQVGYPLPEREDDRLAAVAEYDLPGLSTIETFDRLTRLVANHFNVSVAFVGLVKEDEEEFLACHGADWATLTREDSICTYSMLEEEVMVVENVQADPRFEHNETLQRLDIRSYAGANLTTPDGQVVGELCLIHDEPRGYTDEERAELQLFADEVMEQLELRRRLTGEVET